MDVGWEAVVVASLRAVASPRDATRRRLHLRCQDRLRTYEGPSPFRANEGEERPGLTHFHSGPYPTERSFHVRPDFEPGHADPGETGRVPGHSGPKRTRPKGVGTVLVLPHKSFTKCVALILVWNRNKHYCYFLAAGEAPKGDTCITAESVGEGAPPLTRLFFPFLRMEQVSSD